MRHEMLDGTSVDLDGLTATERDYLAELAAACARPDADYFEALKKAKGPGSPALQGGKITAEALEHPVYRVANDIVARLGIREGWILAPGVTEKPTGRPEDLMSVTQAADELGITRAAVHDALREGRLKGQQIGNAWVLNRADVAAYRERVRSRGGAG